MYQNHYIISIISITDVNECQEKNGGCSHQCVNIEGSYECACPAGYKTQADQKTCEGNFVYDVSIILCVFKLELYTAGIKHTSSPENRSNRSRNVVVIEFNVPLATRS